MNRYILNFTNLALFVVSLLFIINIIYDNFNQLKNTLESFKYLDIYFLTLLTIINAFVGNFLTYILIKPYIKLKLNKFTEINLISNLFNQLLPFFGTIYKGYILKKFNFSYISYINLYLLTKILHIYLVFIFSLFLIIIFEEKILFKIIIILIAITIHFLILFFLKLLKLNQKYFQNKYFQNIKSFFNSFNLIKNKIFFIIIMMHITNFLIFFILVDNIISVEVKTVIIIYVLRFFINNLPVIGSTTTTVVASTFAFSLMDLSFLESFLINFLHTIIIVVGSIMCLFINYLYKEYKN